VLVTLTSSTQIYRDVWFTSTEQLFTGTFTPTHASGSETFDLEELVVDLPNLKRNYTQDSNVVIRVLGRSKDYKPALRRSGSIEPSPILLKEALYEIVNEQNDEVIVPFSTGSVKFSKLSYDGNGNYFTLRMKNLVQGGLYRLKIRADYKNFEIFSDDADVYINAFSPAETTGKAVPRITTGKNFEKIEYNLNRWSVQNSGSISYPPH